MTDESNEIREAAKKRIKAQRDYKQYLWVWAAVSILLTAIWALTGRGYFWPVWAIFGMGVGALFAGLDAYGKFGRGIITEADIDKEIERTSKK